MPHSHLDDDALIRRRGFLRTIGLAGAATVGLATLDPSDASALTLTALEEGLQEVGANAVNGNIAIGSPLVNQTQGEQNIAIGLNALSHDTSGSQNIAIGAEALSKTRTGTRNTAIGVRSLQSNTNGIKNTAIGYEALELNNKDGSGGNENTAVGQAALRNNNKGGYNVAIGNNALHSSSEAFENVAVGIQALEHLEGSRVLADGKRGERNTAIGAQALEWITKGEQNTAIGWGAGQAVVNGREEEHEGGSGNIFIGFMAGRQELGSNKLYIANSETPEPLVLGTLAGPTAEKSLQINGKFACNNKAPPAQHKAIKAELSLATIKEIAKVLKEYGFTE